MEFRITTVKFLSRYTLNGRTPRTFKAREEADLPAMVAADLVAAGIAVEVRREAFQGATAAVRTGVTR